MWIGLIYFVCHMDFIIEYIKTVLIIPLFSHRLGDTGEARVVQVGADVDCCLCCLVGSGAFDGFAREQIELLREGLDRLPDKYRTVLGLYYDEGLNYRQIGQVVGKSEATISGDRKVKAILYPISAKPRSLISRFLRGRDHIIPNTR